MIQVGSSFSLSWTVVKIIKSSANNFKLHLKPIVTSLIYTRNNRGPRTEPRGAPALILPYQDALPLRIVRCFLFDRKHVSSINSFPETPFRGNLYIRPSCQTRSKALDISRRTERTSRVGLQSNAKKMEWLILSNWLTVESPG